MKQLHRFLAHPVMLQVVLTICFMAIAGSASAQVRRYPSHPVKWIVPFPPGGAVDVLARVIAREVEKDLGQPIIIDNKPGGMTFIALQALRTAPPDGYTMMITANDLTIAPNMFKSPIDVEKDIDCVAHMLAGRGFLLIARKDFPAENARQAVEYLRANPGRLSYASYGNGSISHLEMELFAGHHKIKMMHVPYKGAAPALQDLMGGLVDLMADSAVNSLPLAESGKIKILAVMGKKRFPEIPNVMTLAEAGAPSPADDVATFLGLIAPKGTAAAAVQAMSKAVEGALQRRELQDALAQRYATPQHMAGKQFCAKLAQDSQAMRKVIKENGITAAN